MSIWHELLSVAVHAPSPHNVQPWRVKVVSDSVAELYIDSTRTLPKEDLTGSFIISTMGIFIEALNILAGNRGRAVQYELSTDTELIAPAILEIAEPTLIPFARLTLVAGKRSAPDHDEELFLKRRTSRLHFQERDIPESSISALEQVATGRGQHFSVIVDRKQIERILQMNTDALFEDLNSSGYHDEIIEWFRYTKRQSLRHLDGLDARCMNTSPVSYWIVANLPILLRMPVARQILGGVYRRQTGSVPTLGIIGGKFWAPADAIDAGRFLMRFWLETARQNLHIHPYGNLVTNYRAARSVKEETGIDDIWLIFKIGYSIEPPKSHRLPVERILV